MNNQKGELVTIVAITLAVILGLVFIPNDASKTFGLQNKQNKITQKEVTREKIVPVILVNGKQATNVDGSPQFKTVEETSIVDKDEQQSVTLWERFLGLPFVLLILVIGGVVFIPGFGIALWKWLKERLAHRETVDEAKTIVNSMDDAFATIAKTLAGEALPGEIDRAALADRIEKNMKAVLKESYDKSTKDFVKELRA